MMTRKFRLFLLSILFLFSIILQPLYAAQAGTEWVIGARKFTFTRNQTGAVAEGIAAMFPARILEKMSSSMYRAVDIEENAQRELYKIRMEKNSYFLQLSSKIKTRDSLVLGNYSQKELELKLQKENESILELKKKLEQNIQRQKELEAQIQAAQNSVNENLVPEEKKSDSFIKSLFTSQSSSQYVQEKIVLYKKDISAVFTPSQTGDFEKQVVDAKINCLISGEITGFDEYMSVTVKANVYPGGKEIAVVTEIGTVDDADLIASAVARQLVPAVTNSMPCVLIIKMDMEEEPKDLCVYVDDVLYNDVSSEFTIDSGVHFIQFTAEGYKNAGTSYYFEGNKNYVVQVSLSKTATNTIFVRPKAIMEGQFIANGVSGVKLQDNTSKITVNGEAVLAQFITEDKNSAFLYIPQNKITEGALYTAKLKTVNHKDFIEKRRREMYLSYSVLVTSLMPTLISKGIVESYKPMLADTNRQKDIENLDDKIQTANGWVLASNIFTGVSIACGIWFIFELYRYFSAANSVLPASTKISFDYLPAAEVIPPVEQETLEDNSVQE